MRDRVKEQDARGAADDRRNPALGDASSRVSPWVQLRSAGSHPFIYKRMVGHVDPAARPGDVVQVYDKSNSLFGRALFNPRSQIVLRMLSWGDRAVDDEFWRDALQGAVSLRKTLRLDESSDAYRLVHAEGDGLSGLIAERYGDALVLELFSLGVFQRRREIARALGEALGAPSRLERAGGHADAWRVVIRADAGVQRLEGFTLDPAESESRHGEPDDARSSGRPIGLTAIREHGVRYRVDLAGGHKTGFFCDQRDNRRRFAGMCREATVLDLCCYTGGFGLCAKTLGEAREVTSVDLDENALAIAKQNFNLNHARVDLVHSDAFIYLRQMIANGRHYDAVVLDPPKLAASREEYDEAIRKYYDLNSLAAQVVRPGGILLTCSCSGLVSGSAFVETVHRSMRRVGRTGQMFDRTGAAPDHPIALNCPESGYLKAVWLRLS